MRNRIITQSEALFAGPSPATGMHYDSGNSGVNQLNQLSRIQNASYNYGITRQDINQLGNLAAISREVIDAPTVSLDFSYYLTNGSNENKLGFYVSNSAAPDPVSFISGLLSSATNEKNYFILTAPEGDDANRTTEFTMDQHNRNAVAGIGNGFISNYSVQGAVGGMPTASVTVEALNLVAETGSSGKYIPAVDPINGLRNSVYTYQIPTPVSGGATEPTALRPGDITVDLGGATWGVSGLCIQSFNLGVGLARQPLQCLGSRFAFARELQYPITATMSVEANMKDPGVGDLATVLCNDVSYNLVVAMRQPNCSGEGDISLRYELKNAKMDSQNFGTSIGADKTVGMQFSAQVGGPQDLNNGLFVSGSY
jgi:hypothetical protein